MANKTFYFPCTCGHTVDKHLSEADPNFSFMGVHFCLARDSTGRFLDNCKDYRPDNLRWLEEQIESRNK